MLRIDLNFDQSKMVTYKNFIFKVRTGIRSEICQQRGNPREDKANGARIETDGGKNGCALLIAIFIL